MLLLIQPVLVGAGGKSLLVHIPDGWVNVSEKISKGQASSIPTRLVLTAKNSVSKLLAADPNTFKDPSPTYLLQVVTPVGTHFSFTEDGLKALAGELEEALKKRPAVTLVEDKPMTVAGTMLFRSIVDMPAPFGSNGETVILRTVQYYLPDGDGAAIVSFYTLKSKADTYLPIFEDAISKTLK